MSIEFKSEEEVLTLWKDKAVEAVIFEGTVYDMQKFKLEHPGGKRLIEQELGKNIEEPFEEEGHSKAARKIFKTLPVIG